MVRSSVTLRYAALAVVGLTLLVALQAAAAPMSSAPIDDCDPFVDFDDCTGWMCSECEEEYGSGVLGYTCCLGGWIWCENYCYWPL